MTILLKKTPCEQGVFMQLCHHLLVAEDEGLVKQ